MIQNSSNANGAIRVVLADDHDLVRSGIKALLSTVEGVEVVAEARNGNELLALLETVQPDVVMTDISMPGMDGITAIADVPATIAGIVFDERLEKHPHPGRKRRHTGSEIGFEGRPGHRVFEELAELAPDLVALPFTNQEIAEPMKCLDDAHRRSPRPEQLAGRGRTEGDRHVAELDRATTRIGVHYDFGRNRVGQPQIVRRGHAINQHPGLVASRDGVDRVVAAVVRDRDRPERPERRHLLGKEPRRTIEAGDEYDRKRLLHIGYPSITVPPSTEIACPEIVRPRGEQMKRT